MKANFTAYDDQIAKLTPYLESDQSDAVRKKIEELSLKKVSICDDVMEEAMDLYTQKKISYDYYLEIADEMERVRKETLENGVSWYTEAVSAKVYDLALKEVIALSALGTKILGGYMLTSTGKKYVRERLSKYTILNEDAIDCRQFECATYTMEEATSKFNISFKYAENWERSGQQTHCKVYFYNKKPVMAVAYNRAKKDNAINATMPIETKLLDSRLKKHEDYYTAYMCCDMQMNHPCVKRVLTKLKDHWKQASKKLDKDIQNEINEAVSDGTIDKKYQYISEAAENGYLTDEQVERYVRRLNVRK